MMTEIRNTLADQHWRLNHLYRVLDKDGEDVLFKMNEQQADFYREMWFLNIILKARQLGFSTLIAIFFLDIALFNENVNLGIIDAKLDDAKKKLGKIVFAYDRLPDFIKEANPIVSRNTLEITFQNGSKITVGTSHRGGTLQYLHISELGKIAAATPLKAREIRTGALNTVTSGQFIFIESTAEGQDGDFYDACQIAEAKLLRGTELTPLDFKFHFYPWHKAAEYRLPSNDNTPIPSDLARYFEKLEDTEGIKLTQGQKAWYVKKKETQAEDMKREYPATSKEAFEAAIKGAIFGEYMTVAEEQGRVGVFPPHPNVPVHTFWDIGRRDYTSIWFAQIFAGKVRIIHYYQNCLTGMPHYAEYLMGTTKVKKAIPDFTSKKDIEGIFAEKGWIKGQDIFPHDAKVIEWGSDRSRVEQLIKVGLNPAQARDMTLWDGINAARATIGLTEFDEAGVGVTGLKVMKLYKWEWDELKGGFKTGTERHDIYSHGAAAFRYLATSWRDLPPELEPEKPKPERQAITTNEDGSLNMAASRASEIIAIRQRMKELERERG